MAEENKAPQTPPDAAAAAPAGAEAKKEAPKKETPANCCVCNKLIKKIRWYYRDGKYYCTKRCWLTAKKKEEADRKAAEEKASAEKAAAEKAAAEKAAAEKAAAEKTAAETPAEGQAPAQG